MNVLITGVTGTLGQALLKRFLANDEYNVLGISRDEQKQRLLPKNERACYKLADVRDIDSLYEACQGEAFHLVIHLAALKCVDTMEANPIECVKTNINGTINVAQLTNALRARLVFASTDKAVYPINVYGQSKAVAEKIVLKSGKHNCVVRYGNVLGSRGSFLPDLIKSLKEKKEANLTDANMTRFWMPIDRVADFVFGCATNAMCTGLITPVDLRASYVKDLIKSVASLIGVNDYKINVVGIRPGEKYHESLVTEFERKEGIVTSQDNPLLMTHDELKTMLEPIVKEILGA